MKAAQNFIAAPISNDTDYIGVNFSKQECPGNFCMYQPGGDIFDSEVQVLPHICAVVLWKEYPPLFSLRDTPQHRQEFSTEHQAMKCLSPVLRGFFPEDGGELLGTGPQFVLHEHHIMLRLPRVQALFYPSS